MCGGFVCCIRRQEIAQQIKTAEAELAATQADSAETKKSLADKQAALGSSSFVTCSMFVLFSCRRVRWLYRYPLSLCVVAMHRISGCISHTVRAARSAPGGSAQTGGVFVVWDFRVAQHFRARHQLASDECDWQERNVHTCNVGSSRYRLVLLFSPCVNIVRRQQSWSRRGAKLVPCD